MKFLECKVGLSGNEIKTVCGNREIGFYDYAVGEIELIMLQHDYKNDMMESNTTPKQCATNKQATPLTRLVPVKYSEMVSI